MFPYFKIGETLFYTYPLIIGFLSGVFFVFSEYLLSQRDQKFPNFKGFFFTLYLSGWLGAKVLFLLTLEPNSFEELVINHRFWLGGGFVFYGGLIFGTVYLAIYRYLKKISWSDYDFLIPPLVICHSFGRIACLLAGCCFGSSCDLPWGVELHGLVRHPVQVYEAISLLAVFLFVYSRYKTRKPIIAQYLFLYSGLRFCLEFFRGDEYRGVFLFALSTSQLISGVIFLAMMSFLIFSKYATENK